MWQDVKMLNAATGTLLSVLALCLLTSALWWVAQRPLFTLREIRIEAAEQAPLRYMNAAVVRSTALPRIRGNFFTADLDTVRSAFESLPWVRKASVRRGWPDQLIVKVEEYRVLGKWRRDGKLLSTKGDLFTANMAEAEEDGELPAFSGPDGSAKEVVDRYYALDDWLKPAGLAPESVQLSDRYAWTVTLTNGMQVELGREQTAQTMRQRIDRLVGVYPQLAMRLQDDIEKVDMRYPNGLALTTVDVSAESKKKELPRRN